MPALYTADTAGFITTPPVKVTSPAYGSSLKRFRASINLAALVTNAAGATQAGITTADWVILARIPGGHVFDFGLITSSVSLGTSVVAIGTNSVHASNGQYRAAAAFTAVDTPTLFGAAAPQAAGALAADTLTFLTVATATTPTSGTLVIDLYFNKP